MDEGEGGDRLEEDVHEAGLWRQVTYAVSVCWRHVAGVLGPSLAAGLTTGKDQSRSYSESSSIMMPYMCMSTMINLMPQKVSAQ